VKLLFDQNLSYRLCRNLADVFPGSEQAASAGLAEADDISVWNYAGRNGLTVVTHDADFAELAALRGPPPKIVWLRCGNQPIVVIERLLREHAGQMKSFLKDPVAACFELY
jgi:predicted nuclease of predicted toxin-antitoxin system